MQPETPAWDEDQASADTQSEPVPLLRSWQGGSDVVEAQDPLARVVADLDRSSGFGLEL